VANREQRLALRVPDDTLVLQLDTGEAWLWSGTVWTDAGHLVGPQGAPGLQGPRGVDGQSLHVSVQRTPPLNPQPGWVWILP
jgi:hypothetical protein